jgi:predicted nucleic acid-binding protein
MASKVFIDANILLDFTLKRPAYAEAKQIIQLILSGRIKAFITPSIVHIMGYWLTKAYDAFIARELILKLLIDIRVIDCTHEITLTALHAKMEDIEDALQYYTAIHHRIDFFVSNDKKLKASSSTVLPVYDASELLILLADT